MPESEGQTLLTVLQAATYLGVSRTKIYRMIENKVLSYITNPVDKRERLIDKERLDEIKAIMDSKQRARE